MKTITIHTPTEAQAQAMRTGTRLSMSEIAAALARNATRLMYGSTEGVLKIQTFETPKNQVIL